MFIRNLFFSFFIFCVWPAISAATNFDVDQADKLIAQNILATGGSNALIKMQSISRYGHIIFYQQNKIKDTLCYHTDIVYPSKLREQIKGKEIAYDRGTDGVSFWWWNANKYEITKDEKLQHYLRNTAERANRSMLWVKKESNNFEILSSLPSWVPAGSQCIQEVKTTKGKIKIIYCFDSATKLLIGMSGPDANGYRLEKDWRRIGNIMLPFRLEQYENGIVNYIVQLNRADLNKIIEDVEFIKPSSPQLSCRFSIKNIGT